MEKKLYNNSVSILYDKNNPVLFGESVNMLPEKDEESIKRLSSFIMDLDLFCKNVLTKVNRAEVIPETIPTKGISETDLVLSMYLCTETNDGGAYSTAVTKEILENLGIREEEAFEAAAHNTSKQAEIKTLRGAIKDLLPDKEFLPAFKPVNSPIETEPMVVSNASARFGASILFTNSNASKMLAEMFGGNFIVIPSSVHEVLAFPRKKTPEEEWNSVELNFMIQEVNKQELLDNEILSNHAYLYDADTKKFINF